jgi:hypothetical protein
VCVLVTEPVIAEVLVVDPTEPEKWYNIKKKKSSFPIVET